MRASDLLPIPNFGDPAGCVAITSARSQAKATEGKAGTAGVTGPVRRSTAGTGLRVGESARTDRLSMPALGYASNVSEIGVTAGETATNLPVTATRRLDDLGSVQDGLKMSRDGQPNAGLSSACIERPIEVGVTAGRDRQPIPDARSAAARTFSSGDVLAEMETELASFVAELNARDRLMRRHRLDYDDPPPLFLTSRRDDPGREHDQSIRSDRTPSLSQVLRALSGRVLLPVNGERLP